jgi:hypothetical protein
VIVALGVALVVAGFAALFHALRVVPTTREVLRRSPEVLRTLRDPTLSDREKELATRRHAGALLGRGAWIAVATGLALAAPIGLVWLLDRAGWADLAGTTAVLMDGRFQAAAAGAVVLGLAVRRLRRRRRDTG